MENKPFIEFLQKFNLSGKLQAFILYSIAMLDSADISVSTKYGMQRIQYYISSLERFGATPLLYPMYGTSELSQAFCRVSAVYGGTFVLRRGASKVYVDENCKKAVGIECTSGQQLTASVFVMNKDYTIKNRQDQP